MARLCPLFLMRPFCSLKQGGFSLLQILVMVIVASIIISAGFNQYIIEMRISKQAKTKQAADIAASALTKYALKYGEYPTPATPGLAFGDAQFGRATAKPAGGWPDCQAAGTSATVVCRTTLNSFPGKDSNGYQGRPVLIGTVPFATLGVPIEWMLDENNFQITYAITESMTNSLLGSPQSISGITRATNAVVTYDGNDIYEKGDYIYISGVVGMVEINDRPYEIKDVDKPNNKITLNGVNSTSYTTYVSDGTINIYFDEDAGAVEVFEANEKSRYYVDANGNNLDDETGKRAHFVVVAHGPDGKGAYTQAGGVASACSNDAASDDFANCDRDGKFRRNSDATTGKPVMNRASGATYFDDYVVAMNSTSTGIWSITPTAGGGAGAMGVRSRIGGNVAIGDCDSRSPCVPVAQLDVYGAMRVDGKVKAASFFDRGVVNAPNASAYYAPDIYTKVIDGSSGYNRRCVPSTGKCPSGSVTSWNAVNLPPFFTPQMIAGTPPDLSPSGAHWISNDTHHGSFHRGNGIRCVEYRGLRGIFDFDEACEDTGMTTATARTRVGSCATGTYARGIRADGSLICMTPAANQ
jgi:type II secretory pathway pseudopilin PulG